MRALTRVCSFALASLPAGAWAEVDGAKPPTLLEQVRASDAGRRVVAAVSGDLDGDGVDEVGAVEELGGGQLRVVVLKRSASKEPALAYARAAEGTPRVARRVTRLEVRPLVGRPAPELLAVLEEPSPDEVAASVRIMSATGRRIEEIFAQTFFIAPERAKDHGEVALGDATPRYYFEDLDGDGDLELIWVRRGQRLTVPGADGAPVRFVIGAVRSVYRFDPDRARYLPWREEELVDFLPARTVSEVEATAQVPKIWGTAQAFWAADGDLETSWNVAAKSAVGQSLGVKLRDRPPVAMIRVVPGCGSSEDEWDRHGRVGAFRMSLASGVRFSIDRLRLGELPAGVRALGEFPLDEGFGSQLLIFLSDPQPLAWARLEITRVERSSAPPGQAVPEVCLSEISFH